MSFSRDSGSADESSFPPRVVKASRRLASDCEGAAILEFALTLPILLALVAGCFELGRALLIYQAMNEAARSGARTLARMPNSGSQNGAERASEMTRSMISARGWVAADKIKVVSEREAETGTVTMRVEVRLAADLLSGFGLNRILTLSTVHQEAHVEE